MSLRVFRLVPKIPLKWHKKKWYCPPYTLTICMQWGTENPLDGSIIAYIFRPLRPHNSLRVNDCDCFHPGIFPNDITFINNNQSVNPDRKCFNNVHDIMHVFLWRMWSLHNHIPQSCTRKDLWAHFLPPGVAYTTGPSHNPFTWRPLKDGKNAYVKK